MPHYVELSLLLLICNETCPSTKISYIPYMILTAFHDKSRELKQEETSHLWSLQKLTHVEMLPLHHILSFFHQPCKYQMLCPQIGVAQNNNLEIFSVGLC